MKVAGLFDLWLFCAVLLSFLVFPLGSSPPPPQSFVCFVYFVCFVCGSVALWFLVLLAVVVCGCADCTLVSACKEQIHSWSVCVCVCVCVLAGAESINEKHFLGGSPLMVEQSCA